MNTNESTGTLMAHTPGSRVVSRDELVRLPAPEVLGVHHKPVPHHELVNAIGEEIYRRNLTIRRETYALARADAAVFGVLDIGGLEIDDSGDTGTSFGFRSGNDKSLAIRGVAGRGVFVCDNLVLSGEMFAISKLHTTGLDLPKAIREGFDNFLAHEEKLIAGVNELKGSGVTDTEAKSRIYDVFAAGTLPGSMLSAVHGWFFDTPEEATDCKPRTLWGLHNSFTRAMKKLKPHLLFRRTVALGEHFNLN